MSSHPAWRTRRWRSVLVAAIGASVTIIASPTQQPPPNVPVPVANAPGPSSFVGSWDYNPEESVDATTGRPEQAPAQRKRPAGVSGSDPAGRNRPAPGPGMGGGPPGGTGGGGNGGGYAPPSGFGGPGGAAGPGFGGGGTTYGGFSGTVDVGLERADTIRDLLEVPERLAFEITPDAVTITDDLDRARTYYSNNRSKRYQLGAATYNAKTRWDGSQLKQQLWTTLGLKMFETYFLSEDAKRLFVIIRIGEPVKGERQPGVNRIYDRIYRP